MKRRRFSLRTLLLVVFLIALITAFLSSWVALQKHVFAHLTKQRDAARREWETARQNLIPWDRDSVEAEVIAHAKYKKATRKLEEAKTGLIKFIDAAN